MEYTDIELLRFTTAGSVDDGKSTLIGRLLYDSKSIFQDQLDAVEKSSKNKGFDCKNALFHYKNCPKIMCFAPFLLILFTKLKISLKIFSLFSSKSSYLINSVSNSLLSLHDL